MGESNDMSGRRLCDVRPDIKCAGYGGWIPGRHKAGLHRQFENRDGLLPRYTLDYIHSASGWAKLPGYACVVMLDGSDGMS